MLGSRIDEGDPVSRVKDGFRRLASARILTEVCLLAAHNGVLCMCNASQTYGRNKNDRWNNDDDLGQEAHASPYRNARLHFGQCERSRLASAMVNGP
jgi:hypothetical protein